MQERIVSNFKKCMTLKQEVDDHKGYIDLTSNKIEKTSLRLTSFTTSFGDKINEMTTSFETRNKLIHDTIENESKSVSEQFGNTKAWCREMIDLNR